MGTSLHRMGRNPASLSAHSSRKPPSFQVAIRIKPDTKPVANPRSETSRIRVAFRGVNKTSAKNLYDKKKKIVISNLGFWRLFDARKTKLSFTLPQ